jgi:CubicO group peptidase (beta-lactamase class C family)
LFLLLLGLPGCSDDKISEPDNLAGTGEYNDLTAAVENAVDSHGFPGLAVGIVKNDEIVYAKGFGYANHETKEMFP